MISEAGTGMVKKATDSDEKWERKKGIGLGLESRFLTQTWDITEQTKAVGVHTIE